MLLEPAHSCAKPLGGFVFISIPQFCAAWSAYRERRIRLVDLSTWFACWEMVARRCQLDEKRHARFDTDEIIRLGGHSSAATVRASLRRLTRAKLLVWAENKIEFPTGVGDSAFDVMLAQITNHCRRVPVPRRTIRFLAEGKSKVLTATMLGHLMRCVYYRSRRCDSRGTCKASWVANVFGVDQRNVKAARKVLSEIGWLSRSEVPQWRLNRFGAVAHVNLDWSGGVQTQIPPRRATNATELPPPDSDRELLTEFENQKPAVAVRTGFLNSELGKAPTLSDVKREDLGSISRLEKLHRDAIAKGLAKSGEAGMLVFAAAAVHAVRTATRNPCGLFATIVRNGMWNFVTQADEDHARCKLKRYFDRAQANGGLPRAGTLPGPEGSPAVSATPQHLSVLLAQLTSKQPVELSRPR